MENRTSVSTNFMNSNIYSQRKNMISKNNVCNYVNKPLFNKPVVNVERKPNDVKNNRTNPYIVLGGVLVTGAGFLLHSAYKLGAGVNVFERIKSGIINIFKNLTL